jgi:hypothetical protein
MLLESRYSIMHIARSIREHAERVIGHCFNRFLDWQHASGLPALLLRRAVSGNPLGDYAFLFLVERELLGALLQIPFAASAQIGAETAVRFERYLTRRRRVRVCIEEYAAVLGREVTTLWRGRRMNESALQGIIQERLRESRAPFVGGLAPLRFRGAPLCIVPALELMIARRLAEQFLNVGRIVVHGRGIDPDDAFVAIELVSRRQPEACHSVGINAHKVQAVGRHVDRQLLYCASIAA